MFQEQGKRVPNGFISAMDSIVRLVSEKTAKGEVATQVEIDRVAETECPVMSRHMNEAFDQLEKEGQVNEEGNINGGSKVWFGRARELKAKENQALVTQ